ncbi:Holliday junction branch migration DNA helicase RuvB, partial [Azotobacter chroococcum]|nr:Holliday junction branch migration DNA helicase RuvB [Azotobacter chroococcum]
YMMRTPRGRVVTRHAYLHFGLNLPARMEAATVNPLAGEPADDE